MSTNNHSINIKGARVHNLKNVSVSIPRNKLVVVTGVSGSGKSSLAFDTLYAEGQRRYVESLSSYARQFLGRHNKPDVDDIENISPAIAIEQKVTSRNARSTVGSTTEIYDYLKLLFARLGKTYSPISGNEVKRHNVKDVVDYCCALPANSTLAFIVKVNTTDKEHLKKQLDLFLQQGFSKTIYKDEFEDLEEIIQQQQEIDSDLFIVIDRLKVTESLIEDAPRIADSASTGFYEGEGECLIWIKSNDKIETTAFNNRFEADGITFEEPNQHFFSYNNPVGACKSCEGYGSVMGIDPELVIPDLNKSVYDEAIVCWKGEKMSEWKDSLIKMADKFDFPIHRSIKDLTKEQQQILWDGNEHFSGLNEFFKYLEANTYKIQYRVMLSRYRGKTTCPDCLGSRLRKDAQYVKVQNKNILELVKMPVDRLFTLINSWEFSEKERLIADRLILEISSRLSFLNEVGLGYLTLNRLSNSLSGGESQRINLATSLGSSLVGSMYILDEPSIGLHPRDTKRLVAVLRNLQQIGNTVIVVEHEEEVMQEADYIIDIGPLAGSNGGNIVAQGNLESILSQNNTLTAQYLSGEKEIAIPVSRRTLKNKITINGASEHNLKIDKVDFPLEGLVCVTGVSGSGKSTLVSEILFPALSRELELSAPKPGKFSSITGDIKQISAVDFINQNPIGKSSRSNPVTYVKAFDEIRSLFANTQASKSHGIKPSHFSFNVAGGRCDNCEGEGQIKVEMQFMADVYLNCDECNGQRYKEDILDIKIDGKNIFNVLELTVDEAIEFFKKQELNNSIKKLIEKLQPLQDVGLGYVQLGQSSNTLSGGEAQRIKLASYLVKGNRTQPTLFIFDEPTTGLHFDDIKKLLSAFNALIEQGHSIIVIEHNLDIVKCADWLIDLGPEGGDSGGNLVFTGTPEELLSNKKSYTAKFLKERLSRK